MGILSPPHYIAYIFHMSAFCFHNKALDGSTIISAVGHGIFKTYRYQEDALKPISCISSMTVTKLCAL